MAIIVVVAAQINLLPILQLNFFLLPACRLSLSHSAEQRVRDSSREEKKC